MHVATEKLTVTSVPPAHAGDPDRGSDDVVGATAASESKTAGGQTQSNDSGKSGRTSKRRNR
jgi:hypothetical protein